VLLPCQTCDSSQRVFSNHHEQGEITMHLIELYARSVPTCSVLTVAAAHLPVLMYSTGCWPLQELLHLCSHSKLQRDPRTA
jgi:methionine salvage enolase-phosphatase E1